MSTPAEETKPTTDAVQGASEETGMSGGTDEQAVKQEGGTSAPAAAAEEASASSNADEAVKMEEDSTNGGEAESATTGGEPTTNGDKKEKDGISKIVDESQLGSAAKKRYKWLLKNGHTPEEALAMASKVLTANKLKAAIAAKGGSSNKVFKPLGEEGIMMAVTCKDYPSSVLSNEQCKQVKSAILKQVVQQKDSELKPHFHSCTFAKGYLRVQCADHETRSWLHSTLSKLELWEGASLKSVAEKNLYKVDIYSGQFGDSSDDSDKAILEFVQSQNDGLNISKWKVISRKEGKIKKSIELTFSVDPASAKAINAMNCELNYKFNTVKLAKREKPAQNRSSVPMGRQGSSLRRPGPPMGRSGPPPVQQRKTSFVPIWDANFPQNRGGNYIQEPVRTNTYNQSNWNSAGNPLDTILGLNLLGSVNPVGAGNSNWNSGGNSYSGSGSSYGGGGGGRSYGGNYSSGGRRNNSSGGGNRFGNRPRVSSGGGGLYDQLRTIGRTPATGNGRNNQSNGRSNGGRNNNTRRGPNKPGVRKF